MWFSEHFSRQNLLCSLSHLLFLLRWNKHGAKKCLKNLIPFDFRDDSNLANQGARKTIEKPLKELLWNQQDFESIFYQVQTMRYPVTIKSLQKYGHVSLQIPQNILRNFLDLRNMFSNQENIRMFFSKQEKINSLRKILLALLRENLTWNKNISQNKTKFLNIKKTFLSKKIFLVSRKLF